MSALDAARVRRLLEGEPGMGPLYALEVTGSTNDEARRLAAGGAPEGTVVVAETQTAGRGRHGSPWHSPAHDGLYVSVLFHPRGPAADATRFTLASAVAACQAAHAVGAADVEIKWPNDLLWRGLKVAGTLAELRSAGDRVLDLVVGTGFNVNQRMEAFPPELSSKAASLRMAAGGEVDREQLLAQYVAGLLRVASRLRGGDWEAVRLSWCRLAPAAEGGRVRVLPSPGASPFEAVTAGIDASGALRVRLPGGLLRTLTLAESVFPVEA
jgi:BirA family biotin operon repressor/biotin-[acetyl-CoA-carboxylase] ligase